jgi:hypothetical protein
MPSAAVIPMAGGQLRSLAHDDLFFPSGQDHHDRGRRLVAADDKLCAYHLYVVRIDFKKLGIIRRVYGRVGPTGCEHPGALCSGLSAALL